MDAGFFVCCLGLVVVGSITRVQVSAEGRHAGTLQDTTGEGDEVLFCHTGISCFVLSCIVQCRYSTVLPAIVSMPREWCKCRREVCVRKYVPHQSRHLMIE